MLGYYERSKCYKVYNTETEIVKESNHVKFDDKLSLEKSKLDEKFDDPKITCLYSKDKDPGDKDSEVKNSGPTQP